MRKDGSSEDDDLPGEMVEIIFPFGNHSKRLINPRLGKKLPNTMKPSITGLQPRKILFRPNLQLLDIIPGKESKSDHNKFRTNSYTSLEQDRMYNFTQFEDDKNTKQNKKKTKKATPHLVKPMTMRDGSKSGSNNSMDEDLKILFKNLDPLGKDDSSSAYLINYSRTTTKRRSKRGAEGGPGAGHTADYDKYCGGTFRGLSGVIKSPGYPLYYPNRKECIYDIEVPEGKDYTIKFTCDDFGIQGNKVVRLCHSQPANLLIFTFVCVVAIKHITGGWVQ